MSRLGAVAAALTLCAGLCHAEAPSDFSWRAPLELPAATSMARVSLPAQALVQLQSSDARDIRVFNGTGEAVAFAIMAPPKTPPAPVATTRSYPALPLYSTARGTRQPTGSTQVRIQEDGQRSVWVHMSGSPVPGAPRLNSALFATKQEEQTLSGLVVQGTVPPNTPVAISVSTSPDLSQWNTRAVRGRLYRFEGEGAPVNMTLEFDRPVKLEGQFLRLDWGNQEGVSLTAVSGVIAAAAPARERVRAELAAPQATGAGAVELTTGFLTPLAGLALTTPRANSLLPVRILGRNEASQPWRLLAQTVVYRLADAGGEAVNPPVACTAPAPAGCAWKRATARTLPPRSCKPLPSSSRCNWFSWPPAMAPSSWPPDMRAASRLRCRSPRSPPPWEHRESPRTCPPPLSAHPSRPSRIPDRSPDSCRGAVPGKTAVLWGVLLAGVLLLAGVAWSLLRQLRT